jgi:hypothetical protein
MWRKSVLVLLPLVLMFTMITISVHGGGRGKPTKNRITFTAVGSDADAQGFAEIFFKEKKKRTDQSLHVKVEKVAGNAVFTIIVDGTQLDTFTTTAGGTFEATYNPNSRGSSRPLPANFLPVTNIKLVEIKDNTGQTILSGNFIATSVGCNRDEFGSEGLLITTGVDTNAKGDFEIEIERENGFIKKQVLKITVENLAPSTSFKIFLNSSDIATFTTNPDGRATIVFSNAPKGNELPVPSSFSLLTSINLIEVKDTAGLAILTAVTTSPLTELKFESNLVLPSTGIDTDARGSVEIEMKKEDGALNQQLEVRVENLTPATIFKLFADGVEIATITTDSSGRAEVTLSSQPGGNELLLPPSLNLMSVGLIEVKNAAGQTILSSAIIPTDCGKDREEKEIELKAAGSDLDASGEAEIQIEREDGAISEQEFKVEVEDLDPTTSFKILVNSVEIGTFTTSNSGRAEVNFSSKPKGNERTLPSAINPLTNITLVEVRTLSGQVVLSGSF